MSLLGSSKSVALNAYMKDVAALQRHGESGALATIYNNPLYNNVASLCITGVKLITQVTQTRLMS